jgi:hypothetical protein
MKNSTLTYRSKKSIKELNESKRGSNLSFVPTLSFFEEPIKDMDYEQKKQYNNALKRYKSGKSPDSFVLLSERAPNDLSGLNI